MTDTTTIDTFIRDAGITMSAERSSENPNMPDSRDMDHWKVTLRAGRSRFTTYFSMGYGHKGKAPTTADVLDSLASDSAGTNESFEEWCSELGYETDSRSAERTYKACERCAVKLRRFLGDSAYETLLYRVERQ